MHLTPRLYAALLEQKVDNFDFTDDATGDKYEIQARIVHPGAHEDANPKRRFEIESIKKDGQNVQFEKLSPKLRYDIETHIATEIGERFYDPPEYERPFG